MSTNASSAIRLVVLISGNGSNLQALIDAIAAGNLNAKIVAVISNRADAFGLQRASSAGIQTALVDHGGFENRKAFDEVLKTRIDEYQPDLVILAGFMRILTAGFVNHYHGRMLNIHPSLLPRYKGVRTHERVLEDGASEHGLSIHFVTPELDGGPVILQAKITVLPSDTPNNLAQRVQIQEHLLYPRVVQWFAEGKLKLEGEQIWLDGNKLTRPAMHIVD